VKVGTGRKLTAGSDVAFLTIGPIGKLMEGVVEAAATNGVSVAHYDMRFLKPIDEDILREVGENFKYIVTLEDGTVKGGLGCAVAEYMAQNGYTPQMKVLGIPDSFIEHGTPEQLYRICAMDAENVLAAIMEFKKK
jgi:1-deoxy-D-xylulose-5-phosphate synthase